jgi:tetratricopeptide (TPR) repeat protein
MTILRPNLRALGAAAIVFAAVLGVLTLLNRPDDAGPSGSGSATPRRIGPRAVSAKERVRAIEATIATCRATPRAYTELGDSLVQLNRDNGDGSALARADRAYRTALARDPGDANAVTGLATLAANKHQFARALSYGREVRRLNPGTLAPYPVMVDALIELGRYEDAGRTLQRMVDLKPGLAAYSRVSYYRELHGDLKGAADALRLAVSSGGTAPENVAYVQSLLGHVEFARGDFVAAEESFRSAIEAVPAYAPAAEGLAVVQSARGRLGSAIELLRDAYDERPIVEYAIALGEAELAAGRTEDAQAHLTQARAIHDREERAGMDVAVERALFEADHGSPSAALAFGRRAWKTTPSVRAADAFGWALTRSGRPAEGLVWARRALKLGSKEPRFLYHAGIAAKGAGRNGEARLLLRRSLALNPRFSPLYAPRARAALDALR